MDIPSGKTKREVIDQAVIRFAGDSGDGMQITSRFTATISPRFPTFLPKFAPLRARFPESAASS